MRPPPRERATQDASKTANCCWVGSSWRGHLDGLGVLDRHVPGEARSRRVVGGRLAGEVQPESERRQGENDEGQDHDEGAFPAYPSRVV
jgi:hypothetical protein